MKPEIKEKWLTALKSGNYVKGEGLLKQQDGEVTKHCCLGVLCEIYQQETGNGVWEDREDDLIFRAGGVISPIVLPDPVKEWAEINGNAGEFAYDDEDRDKLLKKGLKLPISEIYISEINDKIEGDDFSEVIPFIEKYF